MPEIAYLNGTWCRIEEAMVAADDRGYQFGDGVYEVVRSYKGRLWALDRHQQRLSRSLSELHITGVDLDEVKAAVEEAYSRSEFADALVYYQITRGVQPREHTWVKGLEPTLLITVRRLEKEFGEDHKNGVAVITHPDLRWARRDIKCTNLLGNILAKQAAKEQGVFEALLIDNDVMTEASSSSLFIVKDGTVMTREQGPHILGGITRGFVLELCAAESIPVTEAPFTPDDLGSADEVFLTGSTYAVMGVVTIDGQPVADGIVGSMTRRLYQSYLELVRNNDDAP